MYFLTNFITMLMSNKHFLLFQLPCSEYTNAHAQLNFPPIKMASNSRSILCSR